MESTPSYVVEDMSAMSDFQLHTLCSEYPKVHQYKLKEVDWMDSGKVKSFGCCLLTFSVVDQSTCKNAPEADRKRGQGFDL